MRKKLVIYSGILLSLILFFSFVKADTIGYNLLDEDITKTFLDLTDTPKTYLGNDNNCLKVSSDAKRIIFGVCSNATVNVSADFTNVAFVNESNTFTEDNTFDTNITVSNRLYIGDSGAFLQYLNGVILSTVNLYTLGNLSAGGNFIVDSQDNAKNITKLLEVGDVVDTQKKADNDYLYNDSATIYFNGTLLNQTINQLENDTQTDYTNVAFTNESNTFTPNQTFTGNITVENWVQNNGVTGFYTDEASFLGGALKVPYLSGSGALGRLSMQAGLYLYDKDNNVSYLYFPDNTLFNNWVISHNRASTPADLIIDYTGTGGNLSIQELTKFSQGFVTSVISAPSGSLTQINSTNGNSYIDINGNIETDEFSINDYNLSILGTPTNNSVLWFNATNSEWTLTPSAGSSTSLTYCGNYGMIWVDIVGGGVCPL